MILCIIDVVNASFTMYTPYLTHDVGVVTTTVFLQFRLTYLSILTVL